jgi:hypothetical protein
MVSATRLSVPTLSRAVETLIALTAINVRNVDASNTSWIYPVLPGSHIFFCISGTQFNYDCYACLAATGCYYCAGDGTCSNSHSYIYTGMTQSCTEPVDYLVDGETCSLTQEANTFSDPLYDGQKWVYDMIKVVPVWEKGYFGNGVRVRINDDGIESSHLG